MEFFRSWYTRETRKGVKVLNKVRRGWYSAKADAQFGHCIWLDANDNPVAVTAVGPIEDRSYDFYLWDDKQDVGEVASFLSAEWWPKFLRYIK